MLHQERPLPAGAPGRLLLAGILALLSGCRATDDLGRRPGLPPNVIFILADDLGWGDLGCYGQTTLQTPSIDRLAAEGMRFTDCYAGSTVCAPSRCCLMTGLHSGHARIRGNQLIPLEPEDVTVAEVMRDAGYVTGLVGKWGLGEPETTGIPRQQGFDEFFGYLNQRHAHDYYPEFLWQDEAQVPLDGNVSEGGVASERVVYSHDLLTDKALDFIERHRARPFFLYLAYTIPHANNERGNAEGDGMEVPDYGRFADESMPTPQKGHAAMIERLDRDVGRVLDLLNELRIARGTVVFFSSDNGPHREGGADPDYFRSAGPLRGIKRDLYEGGIRVPMLVRWPGRIEPGSVSDFPWAFWDFLPTAAELTGAATPAGLDGVSVAPTLLGHPQEGDRFLYWEFHERGGSQAARLGSWKAVRPNTRGPLELYDLDGDLSETRDVASQHPVRVERFELLLSKARTASPDFEREFGPADAEE